MTYLEKLLEGVDVEWKKIWEVTTWDKRFNAIENYKQPKTIKYHHLLSNEIKPLIVEKGNVKLLTTNETDYWTTEALAGKIISESEVVAIPWGGNVVVQYYKGKFLTGDNRIAVSNDSNYLNTKYLFYFLKKNIVLLESFYRGAGIKHPSMASVLDVEIPIPPLEIQQKIVAILDKFTELTAKLTAELTARKHQYLYYRDRLLNFDNNSLKWKKLDQVFNLKNGYTPSKSNKEYWKDGTIPWFRMEDIRGNGRILNNSIQYVNESSIKGGKLFPANSIIISTSATIGEHALITVPFLSNQRFTNLSLKDEFADLFDIKFLFYYCFVLCEWCKNNITVGNFAGVDMVGFKKFLIPIPTIKEQERIVSILDKFDILTTSISEGLPKEIELRKKQYEYYRDMLLTFSK